MFFPKASRCRVLVFVYNTYHLFSLWPPPARLVTIPARSPSPVSRVRGACGAHFRSTLSYEMPFLFRPLFWSSPSSSDFCRHSPSKRPYCKKWSLFFSLFLFFLCWFLWHLCGETPPPAFVLWPSIFRPPCFRPPLCGEMRVSWFTFDFHFVKSAPRSSDTLKSLRRLVGPLLRFLLLLFVRVDFFFW